MKRKAIATVTLVAAMLGSATPRMVRADAVERAGYDIEVQVLYCLKAALPCNSMGTISNSMYIQVEAVSFHPGVTMGTPDAVDFTCGRAYVDKHHAPHDIAKHVFASTKAAPPKAGFSPGTITGMASLGANPTEQNTTATSQIKVTAVDARTGDSGTARGLLVSNNVTDLPVSGGFSLDLHGPIYDEPLGPNGKPRMIGHGEMKCSTMHPYVSLMHISGPFFEGVLGNTDDKADSKRIFARSRNPSVSATSKSSKSLLASGGTTTWR